MAKEVKHKGRFTEDPDNYRENVLPMFRKRPFSQNLRFIFKYFLGLRISISDSRNAHMRIILGLSGESFVFT